MTEDPELSFDVLIARTRALAPDFLGLTQAEAELLAEQHNLRLRVIHDDQTALLTADLRSDRITVDVRTGTVTNPIAG